MSQFRTILIRWKYETYIFPKKDFAFLPGELYNRLTIPIRDQGRFGSSVAFGTTNAIDIMRAKQLFDGDSKNENEVLTYAKRGKRRSQTSHVGNRFGG